MSALRLRRAILVGALAAVAAAGTLAQQSFARAPHVLLVGTYNGVPGQFRSIQAAVRAARPGDWVLVGPGDYKENGYRNEVEPAGVLITTPDVHLRGMNRNTVVVDGTRPGAPQCSSKASDQGPLARNGVEVWEANNTWIENLTVCNYLT